MRITPIMILGEYRHMADNYYNKKRILILGAGGFIGTNLTDELIGLGAVLTLFDATFEAERASRWKDQGARIVTGDFSKLGVISEELVKNQDLIFHFISTTCPTNSNLNIAAEYTDNVLPTTRLLDACTVSMPRIIFLSSGGTVYGKDHAGICKEEDDAFPISSYGIQKLTIEKLLYLYNYIHGIDYRIIRLANPYGPYQRTNGVQGVVTNFLHRVLKDEPLTLAGDGSVVRDYIYIADVIKGILRISQDDAPNKLYNFGSGKGTSVIEVIHTIEKITGRKASVNHTPARLVDVPVNVLDISRYRRDFGDPDLISLEEGIKLTADFLQKENQIGGFQ